MKQGGTGFFIFVVEAARLYSVRESAKASLLGFDDSWNEYEWVQPINNRNGFSLVFVKTETQVYASDPSFYGFVELLHPFNEIEEEPFL